MNTDPKAIEKEETPAEEVIPVFVPDDYEPEDSDYEARPAAAPGEEYVPYQRPKLKGKEAWDNFLYHHKNKLIAAAVAIVLLVAVTITSIPTKYDYNFAVYANAFTDINAVDELKEELLPYCVDTDGNGETLVNIMTNNRSDLSPYSSIASYMSIDSELKGDYNAFLVIIDKDNFDYICADYGEDTFEALDGYPVCIPLSSSGFITAINEKYGSDTELFLSLLRLPEEYADDAEMAARHDNAADVLLRILEAHPELSSAQ